jgi:peptidase E
MVERHIVASSGGFVGTDRWSVVKPGGIFLRALELANVTRPRVLFVLTASGDDKGYLSMMYQAVSSLGVDANHLALFTQPNAPVEQAIDEADVIWVGGGSVANLLSLWRLHQVDLAMEAAWNKGTVLGGVSAGSICWHAGGPTDSFGPTLVPVTNGLGLLPFGNGVHYDSEAQRRPLLHELIAQQTYSHAYATDDRAAVVYRGIDPVEVVTDTPDSTANAYRVELIDGEVVETVLPAGPVAI